MIKIKNVSKTYNNDKRALNNISFDVNDGEIFAFIGHNGAGKTTMIKCLVGILDFEEGDILVNDISIKESPINCKKQMSYVPDNPDLYENMTAIDFINFVCDMYETPLDIRKLNIEKYSKMFNIYDNLRDDISSFSHGMKQKVALIAALSHNPNVLIMDEPFVGLDPKSVYDMKEIMKQMSKEGKTIFFSTHILDVAEKLCNRVAIIKDGNIVKIGDMKKIKGLAVVLVMLGILSMLFGCKADKKPDYPFDTEKAYLAGLLHDITKNSNREEHLQIFVQFGIILNDIENNAQKLWHAISGAAYVEHILGINDNDIIDAIRYHTTAKAEMSPLGLVLYLADFTSRDRDYPDVEVMRELVDESFSEAYLYALQYTIKDLADQKRAIHFDTLQAFNKAVALEGK